MNKALRGILENGSRKPVAGCRAPGVVCLIFDAEPLFYLLIVASRALMDVSIPAATLMVISSISSET